jgi:hypothetical protein
MAEVKINLGNGEKLPKEVLDEIKLRTIEWERMRKKSGLDLSDSARICQLEIVCSKLRSDYMFWKRIALSLLWSIFFTSMFSLGISLGRILRG